MGAPDLESVLDALFGADLEAFTAQRNEAAKELRAAGERAAADQVKALRKPTVSAWTINQLARRSRKDVDALLDAGHRLREAQRALLAGGDAKTFATAKRRHDVVLDALAQKAERYLETARGSAPPATLDRVRATLQAASATDEGRELLARGRLTEDLAPSGFEALGSLADLPAGQSKPDDADERRARIKELEGQLREARDAAHALNAAALEADTEAREALRDSDKRRRAAEAAAKRAEAADIAVRELEAQLREARAPAR